MIRESYTAVYQKLAKDCKANIVPELNTALKNLDKEREAQKLPDLIKKAEVALEKAIRDIGKVADEASKADKKKVKELAIKLEQGLKKLHESVNKFEKVAIAEAKSGGGASPQDVKDSVALGGQITKMDKETTDDLQEYGKLRQQLSGELKAFGEKRWKIIKNFAKSKGVSTNGFRSFPMAIDLMEDECKNADGSKGKALKGGSSQTILVDDDDDSGSSDNVRAEFTKYSTNELKSELNRVSQTVRKVDQKVDEILKNVDKLLSLSDKLKDEAKTVGKSSAVDKIVGECGKLKNSAGKVREDAKKADVAVNKFYKLVTDKDGLGTSDGDLRDGYDDLPELEKMGKEFNGVVDNIEKMIKALAKP